MWTPREYRGRISKAILPCSWQERFEQKDYEMNATLKQLLIKAILGESFEEELQKVIGFYHDDFMIY